MAFKGQNATLTTTLLYSRVLCTLLFGYKSREIPVCFIEMTTMGSREEVVKYHCSDFDALEWFENARALYSERLPLATNEDTLETALEHESIYWENFFRTHYGGYFFKPRRYISQEFTTFFPPLEEKWNNGKSGDFKLNIIEAGCGHGCTMFPLLEEFSSLEYFATDYSNNAIQILELNPQYPSVASRVKPFIWDIVEPAPCDLMQEIYKQLRTTTAWSVLCVFTLSAIHPRHHLNCLSNIAQLMRATIGESTITAPLFLFRDYGIHDMTMYRHRVRQGGFLFRRTDNTIAYYFDKDYLANIAKEAGLEPVELEYATVCVVNKKTGTKMNRVFLHAVFKLSSTSIGPDLESQATTMT